MTETSSKKTGRPKGSPKTGGRTKKTANKKAENSISIKTALDRAGFDFGKEFKNLYQRFRMNGEYGRMLEMLKMVKASMYPNIKEAMELPEDDIDEEDNESGRSILANV